MAMNPECPYISVSGPMGIGKTTAASLIARELGYELMVENFKDNPFVADAAKDPTRYAFQSEVFFLMEKYKQIIEAQQRLTECGVVQDTPIQQDVYSYGKALLRGDEWDLYHHLYLALEPRLIKPSLLVCLEASTEVNLDRIRSRGRKFEHAVTTDYIKRLTTLNFDWISSSGIPTVYIPTDHLNIVKSVKAQKEMIGIIQKQLHL